MTTYYTESNAIYKTTKEGPIQLTNFTAVITKESIYHDGNKSVTYLTLTGVMGPEDEPITLPETTILATAFASLDWVAERWGLTPVIYPHPSAERDVRTAIQLESRPTREHIYTHTGWSDLDGKPAYLSMSGAITADGHNPEVKVHLPSELSRYKLPPPPNTKEPFIASLRLLNLGPPNILWPLLLATYRAAIGPVDFAVHVAGRTGTFKSELTSLMQSHFGDMDARHLPASWNSTANALEALAYRAANALMVIDDFVPNGTAYQVRQLTKTADQIIRAQGNQAGRSRLTDIVSHQTTFYPRGLILSTGEDVPEGHSMRARMLILDLTPGAIRTDKLTTCQQCRPQYAEAMSAWVHWLAGTNAATHVKHLARQIRDQNIGIGHTRTPAIIGELLATMQLIGEYAVERGWSTVDEMSGLYLKAQKAVLEAAAHQTDYLKTADPVEAIFDVIRMMLSTGLAHIKTKTGGIPADAQRYGWTEQQVPGELSTYRANGPRLGWIDPEEGEFLIDPNVLNLIKKHSQGKLSVTNPTLIKRMKESGVITRCEESRQRNTVRVTVEGHPRQCICTSIDNLSEDDGN